AERQALGGALRDDGAVSVTEWNQSVAKMFQSPDQVRNQALQALNRVTRVDISDPNDPRLVSAHQFLSSQPRYNGLVEPLEKIRHYSDPQHPDYDPSYRVSVIAEGDQVVAASISWSFTSQAGTKVRVVDYNTPIEVGLPSGHDYIDQNIFADLTRPKQPNE